MSDTGSKSSKESIDNYINDEEAIKLIIDAYEVSYDEAIFVWKKFIETVERARRLSESLK